MDTADTALAFRWGHEDASGASTNGGHRFTPLQDSELGRGSWTEDEKRAYLAGHALALMTGARACLLCCGSGKVETAASYAQCGGSQSCPDCSGTGDGR